MIIIQNTGLIRQNVAQTMPVMIGGRFSITGILPTLTITVSKVITADYETIQEAVDSITTLASNNYIISVIDKETYEEQVTVPALTGSGSLTIQGTYDKNGRTKISFPDVESQTTLNALMDISTGNITIKGFEFDRRTNSARKNNCCINFASGIGDITVAYNKFEGGGFSFDSDLPSKGTVGITHDAIKLGGSHTGTVQFYNNLFRWWASSGIDCNFTGTATYKLFKNTVVKCQEFITIITWTPANVTTEIFNNILDFDAEAAIDCTDQYIIWNRVTGTNSGDLDVLNYNLYVFRNEDAINGVMRLYNGKGADYDRLADLQAGKPQFEVNGLQPDPLVTPIYIRYCDDYNLLFDSPAVDVGDSSDGITDDIDGETRTAIPDIGAYTLKFGSHTDRRPQLDILQNATYWYRITNTTDDGDEFARGTTRFSIDLDTVRVL